MEPAKKIAACDKCEGRNYLLERRGDFAVARVCDCSRPCKLCGGQGHTYVERKQGPRSYQVLTPCTCRLLETRVERFNRAGVPGVMAHATLENFQPCNAAQDRALQITKAFSYGYGKQTSKGFILSGPVGSGKTHLLATALTQLVLERGAQAQYAEISLLYATIRRGFQDGKSGGEIIQPLSEVEVLAIDELGKGRGSQFEMETMDELIARRYNAGRITLFATNYSLEPEKKAGRPASGHVSTAELKHAARESELLRERVGERIYSRLCEMCDFVQMPPDTMDRRRAKHELESTAHPARAAHRRT